ncbi:MAG: sterol carrier family protein [Aeromicrobium sp.]|uniref:sterol carrier family protein n=1 Tax=Aeromicrobium sp. TaxID=1871063 RepID=UPI00262FF4F8|nr:sterol carrier family protein [Aeromicrobium sp.]MDF1706271.1 sterol carrier family protein [Aeromicrobium sp.]
MARRLTPLPAAELAAVLDRLDAGGTERADLAAATRHFLAVLEGRSPGHSVEVRVPPFAAVQVIEGAKHTRGTPPAVVETDAVTWIALARGTTTWSQARSEHRVRASGERSDLTPHLPLT